MLKKDNVYITRKPEVETVVKSANEISTPRARQTLAFGTINENRKSAENWHEGILPTTVFDRENTTDFCGNNIKNKKRSIFHEKLHYIFTFAEFAQCKEISTFAAVKNVLDKIS